MSFTISHRNRNRRNKDSSIYKHSISYNERSDGSYIPKNKTDFLTILSLMLSCYFQEKQRSFTSGDFWVLPRWQVTHFQFLSVFQDGGHVKFPTLGKARSVNFPWVAPPPPPPPPTLGLNIDRCIIFNIFNSCNLFLFHLLFCK